MQLPTIQRIGNKFLYFRRAPKIRHLVFAGGGVKGVAYPGAYRALCEHGVMSGIETIAGSSIGAAVAALAAFGISPNRFDETVKSLNLSQLVENRTRQPLMQRDGLAIYQWLQETFYASIHDFLHSDKNELHEEKEYDELGKFFDAERRHEPVTFNTLTLLCELYPEHFKQLIVTAVDRKTGDIRIFDATTPSIEIALACRASVALPGVILPQTIEGRAYIDGGYADNIPTDYFSKSGDPRLDRMQTLVLAFSEGEKHNNPVSKAIYSRDHRLYNPGFFEKLKRNHLCKQLAGCEFQYTNTARKEMGYKKLQSEFPLRTVELNVGNLSTINFKEADKNKASITQTGYENTAQYCTLHEGECIYYSADTEHHLLLQLPAEWIAELLDDDREFLELSKSEADQIYQFKLALQSGSQESIDQYRHEYGEFHYFWEHYCESKNQFRLEYIKKEVVGWIVSQRHNLLTVDFDTMKKIEEDVSSATHTSGVSQAIHSFLKSGSDNYFHLFQKASLCIHLTNVDQSGLGLNPSQKKSF